MLATALFSIAVLSLAVGIGVVARGFYLMSKDGQVGLRLVSLGSAIVILGLAATFWRL